MWARTVPSRAHGKDLRGKDLRAHVCTRALSCMHALRCMGRCGWQCSARLPHSSTVMPLWQQASYGVEPSQSLSCTPLRAVNVTGGCPWPCPWHRSDCVLRRGPFGNRLHRVLLSICSWRRAGTQALSGWQQGGEGRVQAAPPQSRWHQCCCQWQRRRKVGLTAPHRTACSPLHARIMRHHAARMGALEMHPSIHPCVHAGMQQVSVGVPERNWHYASPHACAQHAHSCAWIGRACHAVTYKIAEEQ